MNIFKRILLLLGLIVAVFFGMNTFDELKRGREIEMEIQAQREEAEKIKNNNLVLREKIAYFETNDYKERIAKEKFNFKREDEQVVIIKPSPYLEAQQEKGEEVEIIKDDNGKNNLVKWWGYFFLKQ